MFVMFGLGVPEILLILVLALLLFGPKRLPEIGRTLGRGLSEFRRASNELKRSLESELEEPAAKPAAPPPRPAPPDTERRTPDGAEGGPAPLEPQ